MVKPFILSLVFFFTLSVSLTSQSLYGSGISADDALVRIIFTDSVPDMNIEIGSINFSTADRSLSSKYHAVSPGMYFFEIGSEWIEFIPRSGKYFTLVIEESGCLIFEDKEHKSPAKTQLYFYNLLKTEKATFHVTDAGEILFRDISPETSEQIAINPLNIPFSITTLSGKSIDLGSIPMNRGGSVSVLLMENKYKFRSIIINAEIETGL
ncbi:MAG: alginate O-acetyltransferase AlgF [Spirochaetaceae bacterium]|nr:alginate O-acetyltransferase AlgF [Spirochaetaceae bacterium]